MRLLASLCLPVALAACSKTSTRDDVRTVPPAGSSAGSTPPIATAPTATITLDSKTGPVVVHAEVVKSRGRIQKGLMYRKFLPTDGGMLFLMDEEDDHTFWMHNTLIPLDIMFIRKDLTVAGILENMQPLDETSRGVGKPSVYVLEVNGGWAKAHGVGPDTKVRFDGVEAAAQ